jgi:predicted thioredoxin/glutaredoxin
MTSTQLLRVVIQKNLKNKKDCVSFIEFTYNRGVHSTIDYSSFHIVYSFNPLTPLDLISLHVNERFSLNGNKKVQVVKDLHTKIQQHIEKKKEREICIQG